MESPIKDLKTSVEVNSKELGDVKEKLTKTKQVKSQNIYFCEVKNLEVEFNNVKKKKQALLTTRKGLMRTLTR